MRSTSTASTRDINTSPQVKIDVRSAGYHERVGVGKGVLFSLGHSPSPDNFELSVRNTYLYFANQKAANNTHTHAHTH